MVNGELVPLGRRDRRNDDLSGEQRMPAVRIRDLMATIVHAACVAVLALGLAVPVSPAHATSRIKDLANVEGVRQNQLVGYGLVVGLNGTGDTLNNIPFTKQSLQAMLERMGVNIRGVQVTAFAMGGLVYSPVTDTLLHATVRWPVYDDRRGGERAEPSFGLGLTHDL